MLAFSDKVFFFESAIFSDCFFLRSHLKGLRVFHLQFCFGSSALFQATVSYDLLKEIYGHKRYKMCLGGLVQYENETLQRLQLVELEVLLAIDEVCREYGITYFLSSGTALGAKRHGGFIPWDDDIDIGMPRADYDRFLEVAPKALGENYTVANPESDDRLAGLFAKVWKNGTKFFTEETLDAGIEQGIFVDVFPYDCLSFKESMRNKQLRTCMLWQRISYLYYSGAINVPHRGALGALEKMACRIVHVFVRAVANPKVIRNKFFTMAKRCNGVGASGDMACMSYTQFVFPRDVLLPPRPLSFSGHLLPVPAKIEEYLTIQYGETWNELPPENQRRNHAPKVLELGG